MFVHGEMANLQPSIGLLAVSKYHTMAPLDKCAGFTRVEHGCMHERIYSGHNQSMCLLTIRHFTGNKYTIARKHPDVGNLHERHTRRSNNKADPESTYS